MAVERMETCEDVAELAKELGVARRCIFFCRSSFLQRYDADGEIARYATSNLEESDRRLLCGVCVPSGQLNHVLDSRPNCRHVFHCAGDHLSGVHTSQGRILPVRREKWRIRLRWD
jgi:hypothetical protein